MYSAKYYYKFHFALRYLLVVGLLDLFVQLQLRVVHHTISS